MMNKEQSIIQETKTCTKCDKEKNINEFHKDASKKDGLRYWCKSCLKQYQTDNAVSLALYRKQYHVENDQVDISIIYALFSKHHGEIVYVGETLTSLKMRMHLHKASAFNEGTTNYNTKIQTAIRKYGWENFEVVVLTDTYSSHLTEDYFVELLSPKYNDRAGNKVRSTRLNNAQLSEHLTTHEYAMCA